MLSPRLGQFVRCCTLRAYIQLLPAQKREAAYTIVDREYQADQLRQWHVNYGNAGYSRTIGKEP